MDKNSRIKVLLGLVLLLLFCATRLYGIQKFPLFLDEALYIRWTDSIAQGGLPELFLPIHEDGQPPFFFWMSAAIKKYMLPSDSLLVIRLISVLFGGLALLSGMSLTYSISKSNRAAWLFGLLYVITPYIVILERIGMRDSAMTFVFLSSLWGIYAWRESNQARTLLVSGIVLSLGIWIKSIAWLSVLSSLLLLLMLDRKPTIRAWIALATPIMIAVATLYFSGAIGSITQKNSIFVFDAWPLPSQIRDNAYQAVVWLWEYVSPLLFMLLLFLVANIVIAKNKIMRGFLMVILVPLMVEIIMADIFFPRYFLMSVGGLLVIMALKLATWSRNRSQLLLAVVLSVLFVFPATKSIQFVLDPLQPELPQIEQWQYISGWPAGYGVAEAADYLAQNPVGYIFTEESDLMRTGLSYYQPSLKSLTRVIRGDFTRGNLEVAGLNLALIQGHQVALALHLKQELPSALKGEILFSMQKPKNGDRILIYRVSGFN